MRLAPLGELMKERGISGTKLAKDTGLHRSTIVDHKYGLKEYKGGVLITLADYFQVSTDYLLGRERSK